MKSWAEPKTADEWYKEGENQYILGEYDKAAEAFKQGFGLETTDSEGNDDTDHYRFTVVLHDIPSAAHKVSDVYCQRREGFRFMDSAEDVFRRMQRLELESEALDKRYEVFYGASDDTNWMKQLFSPSFIVWLTERTPEELAFEFSAGSLCVNVKGQCDSAAELDALCIAAGEVAKRLAGEAAER